MIPSIILLSLGAVMSTIFIISKVRHYSLVTIILKTVASLFFIALGITTVCLTEGDKQFGVIILIGLIFGMLGDVLLGFKYITTKTKKFWILSGMFAFAFGHISYVIGLFVHFYQRGNVFFAILPFMISLVMSTIYLCVKGRLGIHFGKMYPFGVFYLICLTSMFSTSLVMGILHSFNETTLIMFFVGAFNFVISDCMLTGAYFKEGQRPKWYMATYSVAYYIAQFLIAFSILFLR